MSVSNRGRKPIPWEIQQLRGKKQGPPPPKFAPLDVTEGPPAHLGDIGRAVWFKVTAQLATLGLVQVTDGEILADYCDSVEQGRRFTEALNQETDPAEARAAWRTVRDIRALIARLGAEFGFTPSARTRIGANAPAKDDLMVWEAERKDREGKTA
jgi:P27 family predicted phage terminase small subunit